MGLNVDTSGLERKLARIKANRVPALQAAGLVVLALAQQSIEDSGPGWAPFKRPPKKPHQLLWLTGTLLQSLSPGGTGDIFQVNDENSITVGTNVVYAARQNFGWGVNDPPARPFLFVNNDRKAKAAMAYKKRLLAGVDSA